MAAKDIKEYSFKDCPWNINKKGRPPLLVSAVNKALEANGIERVTPAQVSATYEQLLNMPMDQLKALVTDDNCPMLIKVVGSKMTSGKGIEIIEAMLDRAHGKALAKMEISGPIKIKVNITK